jgi:ligand-binding sensor domain-containing protein
MKSKITLPIIMILIFCSFGFCDQWDCYTDGNEINVVAYTEKQIWTGGNGGVVVWNPFSIDYKKYTIIDGLLSNKINAILPASNGIIYIGTSMGLSMFDPTAIYHIKFGELTFASEVVCMVMDHDGILWMGVTGRSQGLWSFDGNKFTQYTEKDGLINNDVISIMVDQNNKIWVGTTKGISVFDRVNWTSYSVENGLPTKRVNAIHQLPNGNILIGTSSLCARYANDRWRTIQGIKQVRSITHDILGNPWLSNGNLYMLQNEEDFILYDHTKGLPEDAEGEIHSILYAQNGLLEIATSVGLIIFNNQTFMSIRTDDKLPGNSIDIIRMNKTSGDLWYGTKNRGIGYFDGDKWQVFNRIEGFLLPSIQEIDFDKSENIWIGTRGVLTYQKNSSNLSEWKFYDTNSGLIHNYVHDIDFGRNGNTFIATQGGISLLNKDGAFHNYTTKDGLTENNVTCLQVDSDGLMYCGTHNGFLKFNEDDTWSIVKSGIDVLNIEIDSKGNLWILSSSSVNKLDKDHSWVTFYQFGQKYISDFTCLNIDPFDNLWLGTASKGVMKFDGINADIPIFFTTADKLADNKINNIMVDKHNIKWFATDYGISMLDDTQPSIQLSMLKIRHQKGDTVRLLASIKNPYFEKKVWLYLGLYTPDGSYYYAPSWRTDNDFIVKTLPAGIDLPAFEILSFVIPNTTPPINQLGNYSFTALLVDGNSGKAYGSVSQVDFTVE